MADGDWRPLPRIYLGVVVAGVGGGAQPIRHSMLGDLALSPSSALAEKQEAALCGMHCLNNLVQGPVYNEVALAEIAHSLSRREKEVLLAADDMDPATAELIVNEESAYVDESGNFAVEVLEEALKQLNPDLVMDPHRESVEAALQNPNDVEAFVLNYSAHWIAIRRLYDHWWNLDSKNKEPRHLSDTYVAVFLAQLRAQGYSIFVLRGVLPEVSQESIALYPRRWFDVDRLLAKQAPARHPITEEDEALARALRESLATATGTDSGTGTSTGGRGDGSSGSGRGGGAGDAVGARAGAGAARTGPATSPSAVDVYDEEEEMRRAIAESEAAFASSAPSAPGPASAPATAPASTPASGLRGSVADWSRAPVASTEPAPSAPPTAAIDDPPAVGRLGSVENEEEAAELAAAIAASIAAAAPTAP